MCIVYSCLIVIIIIDVCVFDLILTDCLSETGQYKDHDKMKRLLKCREDEVKAVYHEKELVDVLLTKSHQLEEHMTGMLTEFVPLVLTISLNY